MSAVSPNTEELHARGLLLRGLSPRACLLSDPRARDAEGSLRLPEISVRILPRLARPELDGLLGLDYFRQFDRVCFQLSAMRLELTYPGG